MEPLAYRLLITLLKEFFMSDLVPLGLIEKKIFLLHGEKVMFDSDLAELYGVETKALNRAVKRNADRFPEDFVFQLSSEEYQILRCQFGTSSSYGGRRFLPYAFTEQGVAMLSGVLKSKQAIAVHVSIIRTFAKLRQWVVSHQELSQKLIS